MKRKKFEYMILNPIRTDTLSDVGNDGWELVTVDRNGFLYFKREKEVMINE